MLNTYTNKPVHTNITKSEHWALENIRKDKDHIIFTAYKGVALVELDKTEYITNAKPSYKTIQNTSISANTHLQLSTKNSLKFCKTKNNNFISETEYTQWRPHGSNSTVASFYGLLKIHKNNMPMHPILSACGTATRNTTKFIPKILQNFCGKTSSFIKDSADFIQKIKHLSINWEEETLVTFDARGLFTSIPVHVALPSYQFQNFYLHQFHQCLQDPYRKIHQTSGIHYHLLLLLLQ